MENIYNDLVTLFEYRNLLALGQIIVIDFVLAGDNAVVVGLAASRVAPELRAKVIFWGIAGAVVLRIMFAAVATQLLTIIGLTFAGGVLLLWVCWKMYREISMHQTQAAYPSGSHGAAGGETEKKGNVTMGAAVLQVIIADVSMSLDNVLAVAGASREHPWVLVFGLALSIALMGLAASFIAKLLNKHRWIAYVGLAVILYIAGEMIYRGALEIWPGAA